jgi:D-amino-acid dehydrogenase
LDFEALDRAACVALEPALSETAHNLAGGLYFPREEVGDCHKFTTSLAHQAAADGARLRFGTDVVALESSGGRITSVRTRDGRIDADNVVLACASFTPRLVRPLGIRVPIYPVKGVTITVSGAAWAGRVRLPVVDDSRFFGLVPLGDRLRVSGSAEIADFDTAPSEARCGAILRNVVSVFPGLARCLEKGPPQYWAGLRPVTPTGTPIIDRTPISNLFVNAGHGHLGWTMGCGSGHVMASLVTGESPAIDMSGFRLAEH